MKKFMDWLENSFSPAMNKVAQNPWVAALSGSMMKILPIIMTGSLIFFYNVFRSWIPALPDLGGILQFTFQLTAIILAFLVTNQVMEKLDHPRYVLNAAITGTIMYLIALKPEFADGVMTIDPNRLGPSGMFVAIVIGLFTGLLYHLYTKLHILENSVTIPDFVCDWINQIIPMFVCVLIGVLITRNAGIDLYQVIADVFAPLQNVGFTLPGFIVIVFAQAFLYSMGISSWFVSAFTTPILMAGTAANVAAVAAGEVAPYVVCYETVYLLSLVTLGGTGCTLTLNIMMLLSKSQRLKILGRVCIGPSIFNINEPVVFGTPVVFNPLLMLPMWINSIIMPIIIWIAMTSGMLTIPAASITTGQIPAPFGYIMVTGDFRALIFLALTLAVTWFIWRPFFKVYEKQVLEQERLEAEEAFAE